MKNIEKRNELLEEIKKEFNGLNGDYNKLVRLNRTVKNPQVKEYMSVLTMAMDKLVVEGEKTIANLEEKKELNTSTSRRELRKIEKDLEEIIKGRKSMKDMQGVIRMF